MTPAGIGIAGGPVCAGGSEVRTVQVALPPAGTASKVDVFLLFDDTGSFARFVPAVRSIFTDLVGALEAALPGVEFGFGVGRFEDYGGPATGFSRESPAGRPFILNQPIVTAASAGSAAARDELITDALGRTAPGSGGDGPEAGLEALFQVATGLGFDGNGNGSSLDSGAAGAPATQTAPGTSGDVPPFSSSTAPAAGTLGGVGFRPDALHLVLLATDTCTVAPAGLPFPDTITGAGGSSVPVSAFACTSTVPGVGRFGFTSDAKARDGDTVAGSVAPAGATTVQATVSALNGLGIRVIGIGPGAAPTTSTTPSSNPSTWLSAIARLTGAVDRASGTPRVFSTSLSLPDLRDAIAATIAAEVMEPIDIAVDATALPPGLSLSITPDRVEEVSPGDAASFLVDFQGDGTPVSGTFALRFLDIDSGAVLATIPVSIACGPGAGDVLCYLAETTSGTAFAPPGEVALVDQFGSGVFRVDDPVGLCAPASTSGMLVEAPATYREVYPISGDPAEGPVEVVEGENRFGRFAVRTSPAGLLLFVPTAVCLDQPGAPCPVPLPPPGPPGAGTDPFKCYPVVADGEAFQAIPNVMIDDQFSPQARRFDLVRPSRFCTPADTDAGGIGSATGRLLCYEAVAAGPEGAARLVGLRASNQFGPQTLDVIRSAPLEFCVPSTETGSP